MSPTTKVSKKKRHRRFHCGKLLPMVWGRRYHHRFQHDFQTTSPRTTIQRPCPFVLPLNLDLTMQQPPHQKREPHGPVVGCNAETVNCRYHRHQRLRTQHRIRCFRTKQEVLRRFQLQRQWGRGNFCTIGPTIAVCLNCRGNLREGRKHCCIPLRISCSWVEKTALLPRCTGTGHFGTKRGAIATRHNLTLGDFRATTLFLDRKYTCNSSIKITFFY